MFYWHVRWHVHGHLCWHSHCHCHWHLIDIFSDIRIDMSTYVYCVRLQKHRKSGKKHYVFSSYSQKSATLNDNPCAQMQTMKQHYALYDKYQKRTNFVEKQLLFWNNAPGHLRAKDFPGFSILRYVCMFSGGFVFFACSFIFFKSTVVYLKSSSWLTCWWT